MQRRLAITIWRMRVGLLRLLVRLLSPTEEDRRRCTDHLPRSELAHLLIRCEQDYEEQFSSLLVSQLVWPERR